MRIGVDVDGVLADFNTAFIALNKRVTGRDLYPEHYEPTTWDFPESLGYTKAEVSAVWDVIKRDPSFWATLPAYRTTVDDLDTLSLLEFRGSVDIYFITNRMGISAKNQTERFLTALSVFLPTVLLTAHKGLAAQTLDLTHYIDDKWENCLDVVSVGKTRTFIMDRPWNQHSLAEDASHHLTRVSSVRAALRSL